MAHRKNAKFNKGSVEKSKVNDTFELEGAGDE